MTGRRDYVPDASSSSSSSASQSLFSHFCSLPRFWLWLMVTFRSETERGEVLARPGSAGDREQSQLGTRADGTAETKKIKNE